MLRSKVAEFTPNAATTIGGTKELNILNESLKSSKERKHRKANVISVNVAGRDFTLYTVEWKRS